MTLYKWVPERFVEATLRGKLKIGTLLGYAHIENGRNDDHEGFVAVNVIGLTL